MIDRGYAVPCGGWTATAGQCLCISHTLVPKRWCRGQGGLAADAGSCAVTARPSWSITASTTVPGRGPRGSHRPSSSATRAHGPPAPLPRDRVSHLGIAEQRGERPTQCRRLVPHARIIRIRVISLCQRGERRTRLPRPYLLFEPRQRLRHEGALLHTPGRAALHTRAGAQQHGGCQPRQQGHGVRGAMVLENAPEHGVGGRFVWISKGVRACFHREPSVARVRASPGASR